MTTIRQKKAIQKVLESNGKKPVSQAMREAGYPETTASNPQQLKRSKAWNELMEEYLPDNELLETHKRALKATKIHGSPTEPDYEVEDIPTQLKAVELGYKIKKKLSPDTLQQFNVGGDMSIEFIRDENQIK